MQTQQHTPGPWVFREQGDANDFCILTEGGRWVIAFLQNGELMPPEQIANARLMATAPKLLSALQRWEQFARDNLWTDEDCTFLAATRAAIAEATEQSRQTSPNPG